jgi:hypothetical protein
LLFPTLLLLPPLLSLLLPLPLLVTLKAPLVAEPLRYHYDSGKPYGCGQPSSP